MSPRQIDMVQKSFAEIESFGPAFAQAFYERMFQLDPSLRAAFATRTSTQGEKFMQVLRMTVRGLASPTALTEVLRALGDRHRAYGVRHYDFETFAQAFNDALRARLGEAFGGELERAWSTVCSRLLREIRRGVEGGDTEVQWLDASRGTEAAPDDLPAN